MNKTRKLTQGAMLLAIVGALMALDRQFGYWFSFVIVMMFGVIVVIYSAMYTVKDGLFIGLALGVLTVLLGDPQSTYLYYPVCTLAGIAYSIALKKNASKGILFAVSIIVFVIGEILIFYLIQPLLFDISIADQMAAMTETVNEMGYAEVMNALGQSASSLMVASMAIGVIFYGIAEGAMIHMLSIFLLKRFRIMDIRITPFSEHKPNPIIGYAAFAFVAAASFSQYYKDNETLFMVIISIAVMAMLYLAFYGYIYFVASYKIKTGRNMSFLIILLIVFGFPLSMFALAIAGFLYTSGPLYEKLQLKIEEIRQLNNRQ